MKYARTDSATRAVIEVKVKLSEKYKITNLGSARQFLSIEIHCDENGTGISLDQKAFITTILQLFDLQDAHGVATVMDPNVKLDFADDRREKKVDEKKVKH